jgi:hypothetical protein
VALVNPIAHAAAVAATIWASARACAEVLSAMIAFTAGSLACAPAITAVKLKPAWTGHGGRNSGLDQGRTSAVHKPAVRCAGTRYRSTLES